MILLDTNVVSALMSAERERIVVQWLDRQPLFSVWITAVTLMEIRYGLETMAKGRRQEAMARSFEALLSEAIEHRVAPFDAEAAQEAAKLMSARKARGRPGELKDTMIAGIAQSKGATLATRNLGHFADLSVPVVNPWEA